MLLRRSKYQRKEVNADRISAVNGVYEYYIGCSYSVGAYGLVLTHLNILDDAINNDYENILIFEDDIMFVDNFNTKFNEFIVPLLNFLSFRLHI